MNLKKIAVAAAACALMFGSAAGSVIAVGPNWTLNVPQGIVFTCGGGNYPHTLQTVLEDTSTGNFTGTGNYDADPSYTWDITGNITGDNITFQLVYTGTGAGYTLNGAGTIASDGSISGSVDNNCEEFTMGPGAATAIVAVTSPTSKKLC